MAPKYGPIQAVGCIEVGATQKVIDTQSGYRTRQPMIFATGTYLRYCTVQCRESSQSHLQRVEQSTSSSSSLVPTSCTVTTAINVLTELF